MRTKSAKITSIFLVAFVLLGIMSGCDIENDVIYNDYSYGLTEGGFYNNLSNYQCTLPDFSEMSFTTAEILQWQVDRANRDNKEGVKTVDEYVYIYAEGFLTTLGIANKKVAEEGDIVSISLEFYIDDKKLEDYTTTGSYKASSKGDVIVSSLAGHKAKDKYEVEYVFPEDDEYHPSEKANVHITINSIIMTDPIKNGVVEENLETINKYLDNVTNVETFLQALKPELAKVTLESFMKEYLQTNKKIEVPEEYVDYEVYRLNSRLQKIGYTYKEYLEAMKMTDDEAREYCARAARENYIYMLVFNGLDREITDEDMNKYFGDNREYIESVQGEPYMKLCMIRDIALRSIVESVSISDLPKADDDVNGNESGPEATDRSHETTTDNQENLSASTGTQSVDPTDANR